MLILSLGADALTAEKIDGRGDHQQRKADQYGNKADRNEHERDIAVRIQQPMVDRRQDEHEAGKTCAAAYHQ